MGTFLSILLDILAILVIIGVVPLILGKICKKYQKWIDVKLNSYQGMIFKQAEKLIQKDIKKDK